MSGPAAEENKTWRRTLAVLFFTQLATAVGFSSIFPFLPLYVESLGSSTGIDSEILAGAVYSAQALTMMIASPIWGMVADRFGRKLMVQRASFGGALVILLMAFVRSGEQLVALRALQGLISGTLAANSALLASQVPRRHTGYAMGMLQVGVGAGVAFGPLMGGFVADQLGYAPTFYLTAILLFAAGLTVHFGVHEEFAPANVEGDARGWLAGWREMIVRPGVRPTYTLSFFSQLGRMMLVPITPLFVQQLMGSTANVNTFTGLVIGANSAAMTFSAGPLGRLGDRRGQRRVAAASALLAGLFYLPQGLVSNSWQLLPFVVVGGLAMGGVIPTLSALLARYTQHGQEGAAYGLDNAVRAAARSVAPMLGSSLALFFGLRSSFFGAGAVLLLTALLARLILPPAPPPAEEQPLKMTIEEAVSNVP
ncbi:MAG: MFS transporter [Anaerolineales bacterium]|jgi:DHA1 family multidrug resistance protein-like MFS transporter